MNLLKSLLRKHTALISASVCAAIASVVVSLLWNLTLSVIINAAGAGNRIPGPQLARAALWMLVSAAAAYGLSLISGWTCETLAHTLRMGYARYFSGLELAKLEALGAGEQLSCLPNEIGEVTEFLQSSLFQLIESVIRYLGTVIFFFILSPALALAVLLPSLGIVFYSAHTSRMIGTLAEDSQKAKGDMNGFADTLLTLFPIIQVYDAAKLMLEKYGAALRSWEEAGIREERTKAQLMSLSAILTAMPLAALMLFGGMAVIEGWAELGTLYIFINLSGNVTGFMKNLPGLIAGYRRFEVNLRRLEPCVVL